jgi:hypothetical protein
MTACRFRVRSVALEPNVRGQEMRRIHLQAIASDPFNAIAADGQAPPIPADPDGQISLLVNHEYARRFEPGDEFALTFRERE